MVCSYSKALDRIYEGPTKKVVMEGHRKLHEHEDLRFCAFRSNRTGILDILACRILMLRWSCQATYLLPALILHSNNTDPKPMLDQPSTYLRRTSQKDWDLDAFIMGWRPPLGSTALVVPASPVGEVTSGRSDSNGGLTEFPGRVLYQLVP